MELRLEGLQKSYGKKRALNGVDLTLTEGIYGLLGPNGAGKSTMMNILTGNLQQTAGTVFYNGEDIRALGQAYRAHIGYMPQQQAYYPGFSAEHFLYYIASLQGMPRERARERIDWSLLLLGLADVRKRPIYSFSGGMRQRLLLAQAILPDPDMLILDEPTAGLDPRQRIAVRNLIAEMALHKIVLISTHVVSDVEFIANQLILLSDGEVLCQTSPYELANRLSGQVWEALVPEAELPRLRTLGRISGVTREREGVLVRILAEQRPAGDAVSVRPSLEDVYLHYFGEPELS